MSVASNDHRTPDSGPGCSADRSESECCSHNTVGLVGGTIVLLLLWACLSTTHFVPVPPGEEANLKSFTLLKVGLMPWVLATFFFQILAAQFQPVSDLFGSSKAADRKRACRWLGAVAALFLFLSAARVVSQSNLVGKVIGERHEKLAIAAALHAEHHYEGPADDRPRQPAAATAPAAAPESHGAPAAHEAPAPEGAHASPAHEVAEAHAAPDSHEGAHPAPAQDRATHVDPLADHSLEWPSDADTLAAVIVGSMAAAALAAAFQLISVGWAFSLVWVFSAGLGVAAHSSGYLTYLKAHWILGPVALLLVMVVGIVVAWNMSQSYELPADLNPAGRDALPVIVPATLVGVLPLFLADIALKALRGVLRGVANEFAITGPAGTVMRHILAPDGWITLFVELFLVWVATYWAFSLLYPMHRLEKVLGVDRERIDKSMSIWLDGLLVHNALLMCGLVITSRLFKGTFTELGLTPISFFVLVGGCAALSEAILKLRAVERETGELVSATTVVGSLEASVAQARLETAGIRSATRGWVLQSIHPASVPFLGDIDILVPRSSLDQARRLLA